MTERIFDLIIAGMAIALLMFCGIMLLGLEH
jgi:hypothetical protein